MRIILLSLILFLFIISCKNVSVEDQFMQNPPKLLVLSPENNKVFDAGITQINVELSVSELSLGNQGNSSNKGFIQLVLDNNEVAKINTTSYLLTNLEPGGHTLAIDIMRLNENSYNVKQEINFSIPRPTPVIKSLDPKDGFVTKNSTVQVKLNADKFSFDKGDYTVLEINGIKHEMRQTPYTLVNLTPDEYVLDVELFDKNSKSLGVKKSAKFTVKGVPPTGPKGVPNFEIWWPKEDSNIKGSSTSLSLNLENFLIEDKKNVSNRLNYGHFLVWINDAKDPIELYSGSKTITGLLKGKNTIKVVMVQNDASPYYVERTVTFNGQTGLK